MRELTALHALGTATSVARHSRRWWTLDAKSEPVPATFEQWKAWAAADPEHRYRIAYDQIDDDAYVSTVFFGFELVPADKPALFETATFIGNELGGVWRSQTHAEALQIHAAAAERMRARRID